MRRVPGRRALVAPPRSSKLSLLLVLLSLLVLGGCRVGVSVEVEPAARGGGHVRATVNLDEAAASQVPDLAEQLRVDDLKQAGWQVDGPAGTPDGGSTLRASKSFADAAGATRALEELGGSSGPFRSLEVTQERTFWRSRWTLAGTVDLSAGLDVFGDDTLRQRLGGPALGLDLAAVERELGHPLAEMLTFEVVAHFPGQVESNAPLKRGPEAVWPATLGQSVAVRASGEAWNVADIGFGAVALASGFMLVVVLVRRSRSVSWG